MTHATLLAHIFELNKPLLIELGALNSLMAIAEMEPARGMRCGTRLRSAVALEADNHYPRPGANWDGPVDMPGMTIAGGVAEIPIYGLIGDKLDPLVKWYFDATDLRDVAREIGIASADPSVGTLLFTVDSPGGSARNVPETADLIQGVGKDKLAFVDGMAASAAYWLAAATGSVYATRGSDVGSIGVYSTFRDLSQMAANIGIKVQVFSSGKYKGAGVPGTSLTPDQAAWIQNDVLELADEFKSFVRDARPGGVADSIMEGQTLAAPAARKANLIDGIRTTKTHALLTRWD